MASQSGRSVKFLRGAAFGSYVEMSVQSRTRICAGTEKPTRSSMAFFNRSWSSLSLFRFRVLSSALEGFLAFPLVRGGILWLSGDPFAIKDGLSHFEGCRSPKNSQANYWHWELFYLRQARAAIQACRHLEPLRASAARLRTWPNYQSCMYQNTYLPRAEVGI